MKNLAKKLGLFLVLIFICLVAMTFLVDRHVQAVGSKYIVGVEELPEADAVLVLGAYVFPNGRVSDMLGDRLLTGLEIYEKGKASKILLSGDNGRVDYDEVNGMKNFVKERKVPSEDIFMDHAGFNTYESLYRARDIFQIKKVIIVTQEYHLKRALYIAEKLGIEAYGIPADRHIYRGMAKFKAREILARNKAFLWTKFEFPPTYLGEVIPITGDGRVTDDQLKY